MSAGGAARPCHFSVQFPIAFGGKALLNTSCRWGGQGTVKAGAAVLGLCWRRCVCIREWGALASGPEVKAEEKEKVGKAGELGFAELKRANFSEGQVSATGGIKRWISPSDKSRLRYGHLQKHGGLWADGLCCWHTAYVGCWAQMFALVQQEETLLKSRYLVLLLSCDLSNLNSVHHWRDMQE